MTEAESDRSDVSTIKHTAYSVLNNPHVRFSDRAKYVWQDCDLAAEALGGVSLKSWQRVLEQVGSFNGQFFGTPAMLWIDRDDPLCLYFEYQRELVEPTDAGQTKICLMNGGIIFHLRAKEWSTHT